VLLDKPTNLIERTCLAVPLLDAVKRGKTSEIKHEQNRSSIVANQRQHADKLFGACIVPRQSIKAWWSELLWMTSQFCHRSKARCLLVV
jgi:hypothetical protein